MAVSFPPRLGDRDILAAAQVLSGDGLGHRADILHTPLRHHFTAVYTGSRADIHHIVCCAHGFFIVFHHDQCVAQIAQLLERTEKLGIVPLVQADARLIQDIQHAHEAGADLSGQADTLALAAGEGRRRSGQGQIAQADALQEAQAGADLLEDLRRDEHVLLAEIQLVEKAQGVHHRELRKLGNVESAHRDGQCRRLQALSAAGRAGRFRHALLDISAHGRALGLFIAALQVGDDALELPLDGAVALAFLIVQQQRFALGTVEDGVHSLFAQILDGFIQFEVIALGHRVKIHLGDGVAPDVAPAAGRDGAVHDAEIGIGHDELRIHQHLHPQAGAGGAGAGGIVEREQPRRQLLNGDAAVLAGVVLGKADGLILAHQIHEEQAAGESQRRLRRVGQTARDPLLDHQAVHHDLNVVLFVFFELDLLAQIVQNTIHPGTDIAGLLRVLKDLGMLPLAAADHRREQLDAAALRQIENAVHDLVNALLADLPSALGAVGHAHPRPEQTQVVVDLRHRTDGGAGISGGGLLVDGDGRGQAVNIVHVGLVHLAQEHAGIGAQAFHIAALSLGIDGIEGQGGFSAAGEARDDHQLIPWDLQIDVL